MAEVTIQTTNVTDTFIDLDNANTNYESNTALYIGEQSGGAALDRSLIKFVLSSIPAGSKINSAIFSIYLETEQSANARTLSVYRILRTLVMTEATWNIYSTGNNWGTAGCAIDDADAESSNSGTVSLASDEATGFKAITLTTANVQEWLDGDLANNGLFMRVNTEDNDRNIYAATDNATSANRPKLVVDYTPLGGGNPITFSTGGIGVA